MEFLSTPWGFGSILVISLAIIIIIWRVGYIAYGELTIGSKEKKKKQSPHSICPHSKDIMDIIHRTTEYYERVQGLKSSIIEEQMRYYEEVEEEVSGTLKHIFTKLIIDKLEPNAPFMEHGDYKYYTLILRVISAEIKSYIRGCFKSNHYITYDIEAQREYVDKKKVILTQKITESLNDYWRGSVVARHEIYKKNKEYEEQFEKNIEDIFNRAFLITRTTYERIEKVEKEYEQYVENTIGGDQTCVIR